MPGRKSNVSATSTGGVDEGGEPTPSRTGKTKDGLNVEDLSLPKSMIARLSKGVLPANTQIHKDALLALHKSATVFVSYIASNSNDNAQASGKKTISPQDVIAALKDAELEGFLPRVEAELKKYNDTQCDKRNTYRRKIKEEKAAAATVPGDGDTTQDGDETMASGTNGTTHGHDDAEEANMADRPAKKLKRDDGDGVAVDLENGDEDEDEADQEADEEEEDPSEEGGEEDDVDDEVDEEAEDHEDDTRDETMEDSAEEVHTRGVLHDEALDDPDSD